MAIPHSVASTLSIVGGGSLGQSFAGMLAAAGRPVTLLATPGTAAGLLTSGRILLRGVVDLAIPAALAPAPPGTVGVTDDPSALPDDTGLVFMTKGHQLEGAVSSVRAVWPRSRDTTSWTAGVQNGVVKDDVLTEAFGAGRVVGAVTILGAQRDSEGRVTMTSLGATYLGEFPRGISPRVTSAVEHLQAAGIPVEAVDDIRSVLWSKECNAAGVFGVCVLSRSSAPGLMRSPHLMKAYLALIRETAAVAEAEGATIGDYTGFPIKTYLQGTDAETLAIFAERAKTLGGGGGRPESLPSMVQDLVAGRPMEVEAIFADVVARANRAGVPVPCLSLVRDLLRGINPA